MMELTCAFILISASLVLATPHGYGGYGVKGGASARAESSASAGVFGGAPVAVPLGASYSGSFSKSSSSSSASSSASSSSSSFSYSGSGAGSLGINGGAPSQGCSSGNCQSTGSNGILTPHGSSAQGYNSANAAASATAGAISGSGCQGLNCDGNTDKCTSGQCKPKPLDESTSIDSDSNKCTSGQCGSTLENGASPADYGSNDIRAVTESSHRAHNANDQSSGNDESPSPYNGANSDCSHGKCSLSGPASSKPNYYTHDSGNNHQVSSDTNKQQASSADLQITSHYQKPSTHLETPKFDLTCKTGNCNAGPVEAGHETLPSSYNVPIHGAVNKGEPKPLCDGVKCENHPKEQYFPVDNTVTKGPSSFGYPSPTNCAGSSCFGIPASQVTGGPSLTTRPGSVNFGTPANTAVGINFEHSSANAPALSTTSCNSPNCSPYPTNLAGPGLGKPSGMNKPSNEKLPAYTGGFGGPAGVLNPNEYDVPAPIGNPSHGHASTPQNGKPVGSAPSGCNSPSCSGYPSASGPTGGPTYNPRPGGDIPSEKLPMYTGGFGGPSGTLKPNEFDVHSTVTNKPNYAHPGSPSYNTQPQAGNIGTPGCKAEGNCGGYSPTADAAYGATVPSGSYGTSKPNTGINSPYDKLPTYTGGFGGPVGVFNPHKQDTHTTGPSSSGNTPTGTYNAPTASGHPGDCKTPNCHPSFASTATANAQAESFGVTKPSSGSHLSSVTLPVYPSIYDRPSGVSRPNEISGPASSPSFTHTHSPTSPSIYPSDCKTGNCANYPLSGPSAANAQPGSFGVTKPNTDLNPAAPNRPQYTGGFGGPSGTSKPNDHTYVTPSTGSAPTNCRTPNCVGTLTVGADALSGTNAHPGSYGITKPNDGNNPSKEKPLYTGGFGGSPGLLKPNEYTAPAVSPAPSNKPTEVSTPAACTSGICNAQAPHGSAPHSHIGVPSGAHASAAAAAEANAVAYSGGFGGPPGVLIPYDDGKIGTIPGGPTGSAGAHGSTGAQANSGAGATAYTGSAAGISAGATHGYNPHTHYNHAENIKGGSPCGGGCGGSGSGAYKGGSTLDVNGGHGFPIMSFSDGLNGSGSTSGAAAKSLAGANAFGVGGSYSSSSASAHASAGAYTKGGYGKR